MNEQTLKKMQEYLADINLKIQSIEVKATGQNVKAINDILCENQLVFNTISVEISKIEKEKSNERNRESK